MSNDRGMAAVNELATCQGKIYKKKLPSARHEAIHLKFEKAIILTFVKLSMFCIHGWIAKKLFILGF